jgi:hypothetical protein
VRPISIRWISDVPSKMVKILAVRAVSSDQRPAGPRGIGTDSARPIRDECRFPSGPRPVSSVALMHAKTHREPSHCPLGGLLRRRYSASPQPRAAHRTASHSLEYAADACTDVHLKGSQDLRAAPKDEEIRMVQAGAYPVTDGLNGKALDSEPWPQNGMGR